MLDTVGYVVKKGDDVGGRCFLIKRDIDGSITQVQGPICTDNFQIVEQKFSCFTHEWFSVEQAFQAMKFPGDSIAHNEILHAEPKDSESDEDYGLRVWSLGQPRIDTEMREDWEQEKVKVMLLLNLAKYASNKTFRDELAGTEGYLIEARPSTANWKHWNERTQRWIRKTILSKDDLGPIIQSIQNMPGDDVMIMLDLLDVDEI